MTISKQDRDGIAVATKVWRQYNFYGAIDTFRYNPIYANDLIPGIHKDCIAIISTNVSYSGQEITAIFDSPHLDIRYRIMRVGGVIAIISLVLVIKGGSYGKAMDGTWVATMMKDETSGWKLVSIVGDTDLDFEAGENTDEEQEMDTKAQRADNKEMLREDSEDSESSQESEEDDGDDGSIASEKSGLN